MFSLRTGWSRPDRWCAMCDERTGLVLEGGGMRGIYTAGVLDVFMEQGILFDGVIGVSAGAIHGGSYISGQIGRNIRYYKKYCRDHRFISWRNLIRTGNIAETQFCYHDLPDRLDPFDYDAFLRSETEFYVTCSNAETGKAVYPRITDVRQQIDLLRASGSLPLVSQFVEVDGMKLLDGGCTDSIPIRAFRSMGFRKNVIVVTREKGYRKKPERMLPTRILYRKYPLFVKALENRHNVYNKTLCYIEKLEAAGEVFVIRPSQVPKIGRMERNPEKLQTVYDLGREDAMRQLDALRVWMNA